MCVMDVRPSEPSEDITQALTHNLSTVQRDLEMVLPILKARGEHSAHKQVTAALKHLSDSYELMLKAFGNTIVVTHKATQHYHAEIGIAE
jgi:hypothetical protein